MVRQRIAPAYTSEASRMDNFFELFGKVIVASGGAAVVIYQVFKWLAASWLDDRAVSTCKRNT